MKTLAILALLLLISNIAAGQSVFDAVEDRHPEDQNHGLHLDLSGYLRTALYLGEADGKPRLQTKGKYGEASLKLKVKSDRFGSALAEIRLKSGTEYGENSSPVEIREIYTAFSLGRLDLRLGKQIVVWGRGDNINPTGNITPFDQFTLSPEEDDRRIGNFLLRSYYNFRGFRIEAIWVPVYKASVLPGDLGGSFGPDEAHEEYPDASLDHSSLALKIERSGQGGLDGSLSYYYGFSIYPGLDSSNYLETGSLTYRSFRVQVFGADLALNLGRVGFRFEAAYKKPSTDHRLSSSIANPELFYVAGFDKNPGDWTFILQYCGRTVLRFRALDPENPLTPLLARNRALSGQSKELQHAVSCRIERKWLHESLSAELLGYYNFTTAEGLVQPRFRYQVNDRLSLCAGARIIWGDPQTAYDLLAEIVNAAYLEIKISY